MRALIILLSTMFVAPAHAWEPPRLRDSDGARDLRDGPGPDRWMVAAVDPRTGRQFKLTVGAGESQSFMAFTHAGQVTQTYGQFRSVATRSGFRRVQDANPDLPLYAGDLELRRVRGGWRLRGAIPRQYRLDLTIRSPGAGPTLAPKYPEARGLLRRAMPVMDGVASGRIELHTPDVVSARVRGWPVVVVHDWWVGDGPPYDCCGRPGGDPYPRCCQGTDVIAARGRGGGTVVALGGHTVTRDGEPEYRAALAFRRGGRVRWCHARVRARSLLLQENFARPKVFDARCGGVRLRLDEVRREAGEQYRVLGGGRAGLWLFRSDWTTQFIE